MTHILDTHSHTLSLFLSHTYTLSLPLSHTHTRTSVEGSEWGIDTLTKVAQVDAFLSPYRYGTKAILFTSKPSVPVVWSQVCSWLWLWLWM